MGWNGYRASDKGAAVEKAVEDMMEAAEEGDRDRVEEINEKAYEFARGSNSRKNELRDGYNAAIAKLAETK